MALCTWYLPPGPVPANRQCPVNKGIPQPGNVMPASSPSSSSRLVFSSAPSLLSLSLSHLHISPRIPLALTAARFRTSSPFLAPTSIQRFFSRLASPAARHHQPNLNLSSQVRVLWSWTRITPQPCRWLGSPGIPCSNLFSQHIYLSATFIYVSSPAAGPSAPCPSDRDVPYPPRRQLAEPRPCFRHTTNQHVRRRPLARPSRPPSALYPQPPERHAHRR